MRYNANYVTEVDIPDLKWAENRIVWLATEKLNCLEYKIVENGDYTTPGGRKMKRLRIIIWSKRHIEFREDWWILKQNSIRKRREAA